MMWIDCRMVLVLTLAAMLALAAAEFRAPGRPRLTSCRSPEKETFTCWWEPGDDGGLHTTYALYYRLENSEEVKECPDYRTAGNNSCFFSKNDTIVWVNYNITVVATNALGQSVSEPVEVDVVYIVKPNTPEKVVAVVIEDDTHSPYLRVSWDKPHTADTRSGWITLIYQLRVKQAQDDVWEEYDAGMQKYYNIFSLHSGREYMVQVRCKPDHGFWSEWTMPVYIQMLDYMSRDRSMMVMVVIFSALTLLILIWTACVKQNSVKHCLLPPVPGPKIKGFDQQLLKSGKSEEMFSTLMIQGFPPTNTYEDLLVEYLEVYDEDKQELGGRGHSEGTVKSKSKSDNDSGRGSCDSHSLLLEKCAAGGDESGTEQEVSQYGEASWVSTDSGEGRDMEPVSPGLEDGKLMTWPAVFSSSSQPHQHHYQNLHQQVGGPRMAYHSVPEILGTSLAALTSSDQRILQQMQLEEIHLSKPQVFRFAQTHSMECKRDVTASTAPQSRSNEYVEVQTVNQENILLLRPLTDPEAHDSNMPVFGEEDYSKVQDVTCDNVLLLQRNLRDSQCIGENCQDQGGLGDPCPAQLEEQSQGCKPLTHHSSFMLQEGMRLAGNGYVDSTMMLS